MVLFVNLRSSVAAAAKSLQSCPTLCDPIDGSPPGSAVPGMLQARTLEWVAISFSNAWKRKEKVKSLSYVRPSVTPWTAAYQAPPSLGFSREEYWSGVPLPSPLEWLVNVFSLDGMVLRMFLLVVGFCLHWVFQLVLAFFSLQWWALLPLVLHSAAPYVFVNGFLAMEWVMTLVFMVASPLCFSPWKTRDPPFNRKL